MKEEEIKTEYNIIEKCHFNDFPDLSDITFGSVKFLKKGHLQLHQNNILTYSSRASKPILEFQHFIGPKGLDIELFQYTFEPSWVKDQFPDTGFTKLDCKSLGKKSFREAQDGIENYGSFSFGGYIKVQTINKYCIQFNGIAKYVDYLMGDDTDKVYDFNINLDLDVAFGIDLENGVSLIFTYSEGGDASTVYIGQKEALRKWDVFKLPWLNMDEYIEMIEIKLK